MYNLHALFQRNGFSTELHRHIYSQPVTLQAMQEIASQRSGPLALIAERAVENGLNDIQELIDEHGPQHVLYSEFALLEAWAKKGKLSKKK